MEARAPTNIMRDMASPRPIISAIPVKKPRLTRSGLPPPVFWATKTDTASAPLSPKELANPSMRVAAVKALMVSVPWAFTAPWTSSLPMYTADWWRADTTPKAAVRWSMLQSIFISARPNSSWGSRHFR